MNKNNPGKKIGRSSSGTGARKTGAKPVAARKSSYKPKGEAGADRKRTSYAKPGGADAGKRPYQKRTFGASSGESKFPDRKTGPSRPAFKRAGRDNDEAFTDKKRSYQSKPAFKKGRSADSLGDKPYGAKTPFKKGRSANSATDKPYGSKPPYKRASTGRPDGKRVSGGFDERRGRNSDSPTDKPYGSKPPYKRSATDRPDRKRTPSNFDERKGLTGKRFDKRETGSDARSERPAAGRAFKKDTRKSGEFEVKKKSGYGSADTFKERSAIKSITEREEKPVVKKSFTREGPVEKEVSFGKKSEMKGFKPRAKPGAESSSPPFKGKKRTDDQAESFVSKSKSQSKERVTESQLYAGSEIRLNRYISNAGVSSRREADDLIKAGLVSINGDVVTELGTKVKAGDIVKFNGQKLAVEAKVYILLNKPKDAITTSDDPDGRNTVMDLFEGKMKERIFPVGRLDRNTTGVLLLTNDGELANRMMHPKYEIHKVYKATLNKNLKSTDLWTLANGVMLDDGLIKPDAIAQPDPKEKNIVGIEIHSGRNRIIHRMFEHLGYSVDKLDRVLYAGIEKGNLKRGEWRELTDK